MKTSTVLLYGSAGFASTILPRQCSSNTATVDLSVNRGTPAHLASGLIYGIPDNNTNQIPDHFYTDIGFNYARVGGAQLDAGGWINGPDAYRARFQSTKNNYNTSRKYGAKVVLLPHDIWGTDHANSSTVWPGDNGNWTDYDNFLNQLIADLKSNNMLQGLVFDIWNEPDLGSGSCCYWQRPRSQYLDLYVRTHKRIRSDSALDGVLISGPSSSSQPGSSFWTAWLQRVVKENTIPDQYAWHDEPGDPASDIATHNNLLKQYGAPERPININEYATFDQQNSAGAAWWISRLERYDIIGLRGNWLSGCQLRDFMASLLGKSDTNSCTGGGYYGNGEFQVYKYYNKNMTGTRAGTNSTGDGTMDVYTTIGTDKVRTLTGVLTKKGTWYITIGNLSAVGLPTSGTLHIQTWGFDDKGHFGRVDGPSDRGVYEHQYSGNSVTFPVDQTDQDKATAWGFEFAIGK